MSEPAHAPPRACPLSRIRRVRVGSGNAPKVAAAAGALSSYAPEAEVIGAAVDSGVPEQPVGLAEIAQGARNRAHRAFAIGGCELAVGYEDGLVEFAELAVPTGGSAGVDAPLLNVGCAIVTDGEREGLGLSSGFAYPPAIAHRAVARREPIGDLFDALWREREGASEAQPPSGQGQGNVGKLTGGVLTRAEYARHAIHCALVRFLHPDLYDADATGVGATA